MAKSHNHEEHLDSFYRSEGRHLLEKVVLLQALEKKFGVDVRETVKEERARLVQSQWERIADQASSILIMDLVDTLWEPLKQRGIVAYEVATNDEKKTCLKVTRCLFAQLVEELKIPKDWGYDLYCQDDEYMVKGFNEEMEFSRSTTLMEGYDCCNHCYRLV